MNEDRTLAMLEAALVRLGATEGQSRVMAGQLLKRARQLATEHGGQETDALAELLAKVAAGRAGTYSGDDDPAAGKSH